jgi:ubiquitin carboxyl-terminal hydrolase L3
MVSQPVKAVILLFPISETLETKRKEEDIQFAKQKQSDIDPTVVWIKQTVRLDVGYRYITLNGSYLDI